jgi:hypothetical protein
MEKLRLALADQEKKPGREPWWRQREKELAAQLEKLEERRRGSDVGPEERRKLDAEAQRLQDELARVREGKGEKFPPGPPGPHRPDAMDEAARGRMLDDIRGWLKEHEPSTAERLNALAAERRWDEYDRTLREAWGRVSEMRELQARNPKEFERVMKVNRLEADSRRLGDELRRTPAEQKEKRQELTDGLTKVLGELFELREGARWRELEDLEARVKELRKMLGERRQNRERIIEKRLRELSGKDWDW